MSGATRHAGVRKRFVGRLFVPALLIMVLAVVLAGCGRGVPTTTTQTVTTVTSTNTSSPATSPVTTSSVPQVSSTSTSAATTTTLLTSSTTTTGSGDELSTAETSLPNGHIKAMGFIKRVWMDGGTRTDGGTRRLEIDYAEMLTGAAADAAAVEAGLISPGEHVDNDYFIRNVNPMLRAFTVSPVATFFDDTATTGVPITWETFLGYWTGDPAGAAHKRAAPWWIERDGSTVLKVNQQYLP